jgi:site-specific DNA-methyltransferase (adenine-specific)
MSGKIFSWFQLYLQECIGGAKKHIADDSVDLFITDPPFGIEGDQLYRHYHRREKYVLDGYVEIARKDYARFSLDWIRQAERILRPGGSLYILSGYTNLGDILNALGTTRLKPINHIIWKYNFGVYTTRKYVSSHYHILYYLKPGGKATFNTYARFGSKERDKLGHSLNYADREDVWLINREYKPGEIKNRNELPTELLLKIIQYSSNENDLIADFFLGGFSTAKVALGLKRRIVGFEINRHSFNHHLKELRLLHPGYLLAQIKVNPETTIPQRKAWSTDEVTRLYSRYYELYQQLKTKKAVLAHLQEEFGRGYFAILNQIEKLKEKQSSIIGKPLLKKPAENKKS